MKLLLFILTLSVYINADILDTIKYNVNSGIIYTKEKAEIAPLQAKIISLDVDIDRAYKIIGKKYVEKYDGNTPADIGAGDLISKLKPLLKEKSDIEKEILDIEAKYNSSRDINDEMDRLEKSE